MTAGRNYLVRSQRDDGAWVPLWFGNQQEHRKHNPLYGTSRVLRALSTAGRDITHEAGKRALDWILAAQRPDGGFGADASVSPSIEETALAVEALAEWNMSHPGGGNEERVRSAVQRGATWLAARTQQGTKFDAAPIGLYFAKLWYSEELYPLIFTVSAVERAHRSLAKTTRPVTSR